MKHVSILVPRGATALSCIEGSYKAFTTANTFLMNKGNDPMFEVQLVGMTNEPQIYDKLFKVEPDISIDKLKHTDLIIIPAVNGEWNKVIELNKPFFSWICERHKEGAEVASLCVGAFLLAATGLLDGKSCSTHWFGHDDFVKMYPNVNLVSDKIITDENGIYSSGGANSFWNLLLYILEKYTTRDLALQEAKFYEIEIDRNNQSQFMIFNGQKSHDDEPVKKAQEFIEQHFQEKTSVEQLADMFAIGRRSFERRFKKATNNTIVEYIQRVKIEAAKKNLENNRKNINEVMYEVGYSDTKAFRTTFKKITGLSPLEYRNKFNREAAA